MLSVQNITFSYNEIPNLHAISLQLPKGKNLALIGESGCGKSTLLKLIYGLYDLNEGQIFWNDIEVLGPKYHLIPGMPFMKYLAQDFDLMPFITVGENVGKFLSNFYPEEKQRRIDELLELVEMSEYKQVKAKFLSGGQMQRVALARVLTQEPEVLLLDEPFSHIDNFRKNTLRRKIFKYLKEKSITTIIATHDVNDVLSFSDEVVVLKQGKIIDLGTIIQIYQRPKHIYTASLFGDVNEVKGDYLNKSSKTLIIYPNQLEVVDLSSFLVEVKAAYFKGAYFLNEAIYEEGVAFFESELNWTGQKVYLQYKKPL